MNTVICSHCKQDLPRTAFHNKSRSKTGLQPNCKTCSLKLGRRSYRKRIGRPLLEHADDFWDQVDRTTVERLAARRSAI